VLSLFIAWRLFRHLRPLLLCGVLAAALALAVHGGTRTLDRAAPSLARPAHAVQRDLSPLILSARRRLTQALEKGTRR